MSQGLVVICSYQPKPGKRQELLEVLKGHVLLLRSLGLVTGFHRSMLLADNGSDNGAVLEIFEWESAEISRKAHDIPQVREMWEKIGALADFIPLSSLEETKQPFAHFRKVENDRTNRVIHFEIEADDPAKVSKFYEQAFGWTFYQWENNPYWLADTGREPHPGIDGAVMQRKQPQRNVTNIISVPSLEKAMKDVERAGGKICVPRMPIKGVGWLAYGTDPEGLVFGMMQKDMAAK